MQILISQHHLNTRISRIYENIPLEYNDYKLIVDNIYLLFLPKSLAL